MKVNFFFVGEACCRNSTVAAQAAIATSVQQGCNPGIEHINCHRTKNALAGLLKPHA
jgi:hypothetical protein